MLAEILGTMMLVLFGDGVVAGVLLNKSKAQNSGWIVIATGWGFAVMVGVYTSKALGGLGLLNPAVTFGEMIRHAAFPAAGVDFATGMQLIAGQFIGAILGAFLVFLAYYPHWAQTSDQGFKLGVFCTAPAIRALPWNLTTEAIGTFALVFGCFAIFGKNVGDIPSGLGPFLVGALVWGIGLSLGGPTGYAINPACDLGPRIRAFPPADSGQRRVGLVVRLGACRRPAHRRRHSRGTGGSAQDVGGASVGQRKNCGSSDCHFWSRRGGRNSLVSSQVFWPAKSLKNAVFSSVCACEKRQDRLRINSGTTQPRVLDYTSCRVFFSPGLHFGRSVIASVLSSSLLGSTRGGGLQIASLAQFLSSVNSCNEMKIQNVAKSFVGWTCGAGLCSRKQARNSRENRCCRRKCLPDKTLGKSAGPAAFAGAKTRVEIIRSRCTNARIQVAIGPNALNWRRPCALFLSRRHPGARQIG